MLALMIQNKKHNVYNSKSIVFSVYIVLICTHCKPQHILITHRFIIHNLKKGVQCH